MNSFDQFDFLRNRVNSIKPTQEERENFVFWDVLIALSMVKGSVSVTDKINTLGFSRLPKKIQCMAFTQLDGKPLYGKWQKTKVERTSAKITLMRRICKLFNCSENESRSYITNKIFNENIVNELYERAYEPEKVDIKQKNN